MKSCTLREAWQYLDENYPITNVYDSYIFGKDFMDGIDTIQRRFEIQRELIYVEELIGISRLEDTVRLLQEKLEALTLPTLGYKYDIPEEVEREVKEEFRKTKKQINEIEEEIEQKLDSISIEPYILHGKKLT